MSTCRGPRTARPDRPLQLTECRHGETLVLCALLYMGGEIILHPGKTKERKMFPLRRSLLVLSPTSHYQDLLGDREGLGRARPLLDEGAGLGLGLPQLQAGMELPLVGPVRGQTELRPLLPGVEIRRLQSVPSLLRLLPGPLTRPDLAAPVVRGLVKVQELRLGDDRELCLGLRLQENVGCVFALIPPTDAFMDG